MDASIGELKTDVKELTATVSELAISVVKLDGTLDGMKDLFEVQIKAMQADILELQDMTRKFSHRIQHVEATEQARQITEKTRESTIRDLEKRGSLWWKIFRAVGSAIIGALTAIATIYGMFNK